MHPTTTAPATQTNLVIQQYRPSLLTQYGSVEQVMVSHYQVQPESLGYVEAMSIAIIETEQSRLVSGYRPIVPSVVLSKMAPMYRVQTENDNREVAELVMQSVEQIARCLPYLRDLNRFTRTVQNLEHYRDAFDVTLDSSNPPPADYFKRFLEYYRDLGLDQDCITALNRITPTTLSSEQSLAETIASLMQHRYRYHVDSEQWMWFRTNRWEAVRDEVVQAFVSAQLRHLSYHMYEVAQATPGFDAVSKSRVAQMMQVYKALQKNAALTTCFSLIKSRPDLQHVGPWNNGVGILNMPSLTLDLRTNSSMLDAKHLHLTQSTNVSIPLQAAKEYQAEVQSQLDRGNTETPTADAVEVIRQRHAPVWSAFLESVFCGDQQLISYVRRVCGLALSGYAPDECFYLLHGGGSNGKSTLLYLLSHLYGSYGVTIPFNSVLKPHTYTIDTRRPDLIRVRGKRLVMVSELPQGVELDIATIKQLTGKDNIDVRDNFAKSKEIESFRPILTLLIACNNLPEVREADRGTWRRIRKIPFLASFEGRADPNLRDKLVAESPWILFDLLLAFGEHMAHPDQPIPACVTESVEEMRADKDILSDWISDCVERTSQSDLVKFQDAYNNYSVWCRANNRKPIGSSTFATALSDRGFKSGPRGQVRTRSGMRLREPVVEQSRF